jgi:hypothetical protein
MFRVSGLGNYGVRVKRPQAACGRMANPFRDAFLGYIEWREGGGRRGSRGWREKGHKERQGRERKRVRAGDRETEGRRCVFLSKGCGCQNHIGMYIVGSAVVQHLTMSLAWSRSKRLHEVTEKLSRIFSSWWLRLQRYLHKAM